MLLAQSYCIYFPLTRKVSKESADMEYEQKVKKVQTCSTNRSSQGKHMRYYCIIIRF